MISAFPSVEHGARQSEFVGEVYYNYSFVAAIEYYSPYVMGM